MIKRFSIEYAQVAVILNIKQLSLTWTLFSAQMMCQSTTYDDGVWDSERRDVVWENR